MWIFILALGFLQAEPLRVRAIDFTGNQAFDAETLALRLEHTHVGQVWQPGAFEADVEMSLKPFLKQHGFLKAAIEWQALPQAGEVRVRIQVREGPQYRLSGLDIAGAREFPADELLRRFDLTPGDTADVSKVKTGLDRIKRMYEERGYISFSYLPDQEFHDESLTVDLKFHFVEDKQYRLAHVAFSGAKDQRQEDQARASVVLREGEVFQPSNVQLSREALSRLPGLGAVGERDVQIEILNDRAGLVRVLFKLRPSD